jgi:1,2-diacylglycerol 3-beta-galactosyltransferase
MFLDEMSKTRYPCIQYLMPKDIVILFSDTGGGHRSAGEAIAEALLAQRGADVHVRLVDPLTHYAPWPLKFAPRIYPEWSRHRWLWKASFHVSNGLGRSLSVARLAWPYVRPAVVRVARDYPADLYIGVHALYLTPMALTLGRRRPPYLTVVTDLVSIHAWWCHPQSDLIVAPSEPARSAILRHGFPAEKVRVVGLPVASRFCKPASDRARLRAQLGWGCDRPILVLVGGGEGMGPLYQMAQAISDSGLTCELVVIAGRNAALRQRLEAAAWKVPVHIYGFVTEMPDFMCAADVLITKAGPGTICEAFNAGLPMVLYDFLPGQEEGNVGYVVDAGAGVWAPDADAVVKALRRWIGPEADPHALACASENALRLGRPDAAERIAEIAWQLAVGQTPPAS